MAQTQQTTTDAYAVVNGSKIDSIPGRTRHYGWALTENGGTNGATFKVQGGIDGTNWDDLVVLQKTGAVFGAVDIAVSTGTTVHAFISPFFATNTVLSGYRFYRLMVKSTSAGNPAKIVHSVVEK